MEVDNTSDTFQKSVANSSFVSKAATAQKSDTIRRIKLLKQLLAAPSLSWRRI